MISSRFALLACGLAFFAFGCSGTGGVVSNPDPNPDRDADAATGTDGTNGRCNAPLDVVYMDPTNGASARQVVYKDTLIYQIDESTIRAFPPGGTPSDIVTSADAPAVRDLWLDGDSLLLRTEAALLRKPIAGGPVTTVLNESLPPTVYLKSDTKLYSADAPTFDPSIPVEIVERDLVSGTRRTLATVTNSANSHGWELFDRGESIWFVDGGEQIVSIAKSDGKTERLAEPLASPVMSVLLPADETHVFASSTSGELERLGFDGTITKLWPDSLGPFFAWSAARDTSGSIHVVGERRLSLEDTHAAHAIMATDGSIRMASCSQEKGLYYGWVLLGDTVGYAGASWQDLRHGIVRFSK